MSSFIKLFKLRYAPKKQIKERISPMFDKAKKLPRYQAEYPPNY